MSWYEVPPPDKEQREGLRKIILRLGIPDDDDELEALEWMEHVLQRMNEGA